MKSGCPYAYPWERRIEDCSLIKLQYISRRSVTQAVITGGVGRWVRDEIPQVIIRAGKALGPCGMNGFVI